MLESISRLFLPNLSRFLPPHGLRFQHHHFTNPLTEARGWAERWLAIPV